MNDFSLTGCEADLLRFVGSKSVGFPEDFNIHNHLKKTHCEARVNKLNEGKNIDWATAEALAFGTLLHDGVLTQLKLKFMLFDQTNAHKLEPHVVTS